MPKPKTLNSYWSINMDIVKIVKQQPIIIEGFGRRTSKESFVLSPPPPTIYLPSVCLTFALCLVLCCAGTVSVCSFDIL